MRQNRMTTHSERTGAMIYTDREIWAARALIAATTDAHLASLGQIPANVQELNAATRWAERQFPDVTRIANSKDSAERTWDTESGHVIA